MMLRIAAATALLGASLGLAADEPNLNPGLWEYNTTITFDSEFPIPDQQDSSTDCLTAEDIAQGNTFVDDMEGCEMVREDLRSDGMDYVMECQAPDGTSITMEAQMAFDGDTATGNISGDMETPMGPMKMNINIDGRRIDDC